jgi:hypothetical protein
MGGCDTLVLLGAPHAAGPDLDLGYQQRHNPQARFYIGKTLRPSTPDEAARLFRKAQEMGSAHRATP